MNIGPYMAYVLYIRFFFILDTKNGDLGVQNVVITSFLQLLAILAIKITDLKKN